MLPLLPAILLLLLQGPAGPERIAHERLTGAIQALHRQIGASHESGAVSDEVVFATLLAASHDNALSRALLQALDLYAGPVSERPEPQLAYAEPRSPVPVPPSLGTPGKGFFTCGRTRDGPAV
jgi:hypothetical protein